MSTFMAKANQVPQRWFVIDATDQVVGRLAVQIATILRGKHRPEYTPHIDTGEFVVVVNASKMRFTGKKLQTKTYHWYTRYPGGQKTATARDWMAHPPGSHPGGGGAAHGAAQQARPAADDQAQDLRRADASAPGAAAARIQTGALTRETIDRGRNESQARKQYLGTGRRKTSVARVRLSEGTGQVRINGRPPRRLLHRDQGPQRRGRPAADDGDAEPPRHDGDRDRAAASPARPGPSVRAWPGR